MAEMHILSRERTNAHTNRRIPRLLLMTWFRHREVRRPHPTGLMSRAALYGYRCRSGLTMLIAVLCPCYGLFFVFPGTAFAAPYPERPVTIVVPFTAGGIVDIIARRITGPMSVSLEQPVIVENKTGASGNIGNASVARAKADGYLLLLANAALTRGLAYEPIPDLHPVRDFSPIGMIGKIPQAIVVSQDVPGHSVADFVRYAKDKPGLLNFGSAGAGTTPFFTIELLRQLYELNVVHVPYRGQPEMITDLLRGTLSISSITAPLVVPHVRSGKMKAIAVTGQHRLAYLPSVSTVYEQGVPRLDISNWFALFGPAGLASATSEKLARAMQEALRNREVEAGFSKLGMEVEFPTPAETMAFVEKDYNLWLGVAKSIASRESSASPRN